MLPSCHHLDLPVAPPLYEMWDHKAPSHSGDDTADASLVGYEACQSFASSGPSVEAGDLFFLLCHDVALFKDALLRLSHVVGVLGGVVVDGGHESIGGGADSGVEVIVLEQEVFCLFSR